MSEDKVIQFPATSPELAKLFGMQDSNSPSAHSAETSSNEENLPIANLPVVDLEDKEKIIHELSILKHDVKNLHNTPSSKHEPEHGIVEALTAPEQHDDVDTEVSRIKWMGVIKLFFPYLGVFIIAIFLYLFFFSSFNFAALFKSSQKVETPKSTALQVLEKQNLASYEAWISQFYYNVSDAKILDPESDNSGNGLTNFQKYLLNLNPKRYDTLGLGVADSESLAKGVNPISGSPLNDRQKEILSKYFDMEIIMNKLALSNNQKKGNVAGAFATSDNATNNSVNTSANTGRTSAENGNVKPASNGTNSAYSDIIQASDLQINTAIPGRLEIPSLNINVPIVWSLDPKDFDNDLKSGVVHYPGTALPGQIGTTYISGHSSNYAWVKGSYNKVFSTLGDLADNTSFKVTIVQTNGKDAVLHYVVNRKQEFNPTDTAQFENGPKSVVALSTCWPVGSTAKRLVVFGELTQVEK